MASFKHRKNGKVQICITRGTKFDGSPCRYYREVDYVSEKKLKEDAALFLADIISGKVANSDSTTLDALFKDFMRNNGGINTELKISTVRRYETLYKNQIQSAFGNKQIGKITKLQVRNWVKDLSENGKNLQNGNPLAPKTIKSALSLLSTLYKYAIEDLDLLEKNPCDHVKVPKATKKYRIQKDFYKDHEIADMISLLLKEKSIEASKCHATAVLLILFTGLRIGEVMGLMWKDIDLKDNTISINRIRTLVPAIGVVEDTPKTEGSTRIITAPSFVMDMLAELQELQKRNMRIMQEDYKDSGYVFTTAEGSPQYPRNTYGWFKRFLKKYDLRDTTLHDLRHTHAAILSSIGVQIVDVSKRLGHTNTRITQEIYEYYFRSSDKGVSDKLEQFYEDIINCSQNVVKEKSNA